MSSLGEFQPNPLPDARSLKRALLLIAKCAVVMMYIAPALVALDLMFSYVYWYANTHLPVGVMTLTRVLVFAPLELTAQAGASFFFFGFIWFFARYFSGIPEDAAPAK
jgi:hypothetical protein